MSNASNHASVQPVAPAVRSRSLRRWMVAALASTLIGGMSHTVETQSPTLVAAYSFDEGAGTELTDLSGSNNTGTISGATWVTGRSGGALSFDGLNDLVTIADAASLDLTSGMTVEAWVYAGSRTGARPVAVKERSGAFVYALFANCSSTRPSADVVTTRDDDQARAQEQLPLNTWTHLAMTFESGSLRIYVNGDMVRSRFVSGSILTSTGALTIGGSAADGFFMGRIDDLRIYNRSLSAEQIRLDMETPVAPPLLPDTTAPSATITTPAQGNIASGTVTVSADASDDRSVAGVQFLLDGAPLGAEDVASPYAVSWNTALSANTGHVLSARVRDAAGNVGLAPEVGVTVFNAPRLIITAPAQGGTTTGSTLNVSYTTAGDLTGVDHVHFRLDGGSIVMDMSFDGSYALTGVTAGNHILNGFLVRENHSKIDGTDAQPVSFATIIPDVTPPAVVIASPPQGSTVNGAVTIAAAASDDTGVAGVQFLVDGAALGPVDTASPYEASWPSTAVANGSHTLTAVAFDAANNQGTASVTVTVSNAPPASEAGQWSDVATWPVVAVHSALLYTGEVLLWDAWEAQAQARLWNPSTSVMTAVPSQSALYGAGHAQLADGRLLVAGGHSADETGIRDVNIFDPQTRAWTRGPDLGIARWRPGAITLGDGRLLALGGRSSASVWADTPEIFDVAAGTWTPQPQLATPDIREPGYAPAFVLPDGRVGVIAPGSGAGKILDFTAGSATSLPSEPRILNGTVAMYRPGRVIATGGGDPAAGSGAQPTVSLIDLGQPAPVWRAGAPMTSARAAHHLVVLADGSVLAVGGSSQVGQASPAGPLPSEIWDPATDTWRSAAPTREPRGYQSTALLLPDGRVLIAGGGRNAGATDFASAETFSPPYLFKGARPTIAAAPAVIRHGATVVVDTPQAATIGSVALIRPGSVTHGVDTDQRYVELTFTVQAGKLSVTGPANGHIAPPGYYMLVIVDSSGVPSVASFVQIAPALPLQDVQPPSAPANLLGSAKVGSVSLTWSAAADDSGVAAYNVHMASQPGLIPSDANRIARTPSLNFSHAQTPGVYYYAVTAEDAAGNVSASSNEERVEVPADKTAPTVSVVQPLSGSTLAGAVDITASASDDIGVVGVRFRVDGVDAGPEDTVAPYSLTWDSLASGNGTHQLTAVARDAAGNESTSAIVTVTVANPPPPGLVAAYGFNEGAGIGVGDSSGNGNTGTIAGALWTAGRFGGALAFNGSTDLVTVPDSGSLDLAAGMTVEAWVRPAALSGFRVVALKESTDGLVYGLYANNNAPQPATTIRVGTSSHTASGASALALNTWTHLAATYDGGTLRIYVNGAPSGAVAVTGPIAVTGSPLRIGGNSVWGEYFDGLIDEVRIYNRALSQVEIQRDMTTAVEPPPADTTAPTVTRLVPVHLSAGVSPATNVSVTFSEPIDSRTLATGIELRDSANVLVAASVSYDAATMTATLDPAATLRPSTVYTVTVRGGSVDPRVMDTAGNPLVASVTGRFTTGDDTESRGQWSPAVSWPSVAVHMALLHTGKVLTWQDVGGSSARVGDPVSGVFKSVPTPNNSDIYCAGHVTLADGRVVVIGGDGTSTVGSADTNIFDPVTEQWTTAAKMWRTRWYPSALTLPDGRVLAMSGGSTCYTCYVDVPEVYDPALDRWTLLSNATYAAPFYPFTFVAPDGRVVYAGGSEKSGQTKALNVNTQTWDLLDAVVTDGGSAAMYAPGKILKSGTSRDTSDPVIAAAATTYVLDVTQPSTTWRQTLPMAFARTYHNLVVLPDGTVLAVGGQSKTDGITLSEAVLPAEIWSPETESWTTMASMKVPRLYHSTALLLPDGRVVAAGGGARNQVPGATDQPNAEIYSPPYLFRGARPVIASAPSVVAYGSSFVVNTTDEVAAVSLVRTGATTHAFDQNQRYMKLGFRAVPGGVSVDAPASGNLAPPGYYMLFILNSKGVPSVASFVRLPSPAEDVQAPTAPAGLTATGGIGEVSLSWTAASDNIAVTLYNVHRSTVAGFAAAASNRISQVTSTSFIDRSTAGTYFYRVTAEDAAGNVSAASATASAVMSSDLVAPVVSVTSPLGGASVSGAVAVTAAASDNVAVAGVQFYVDGVALGAEDTAAPYTVSWSTASSTAGAHVLSARARDAAGNFATSLGVTVTVASVAPTGLVAAYGFEEGAGLSVADASGRGNTGTITSAVWSTNGKFGRALSFNGTSSWVTIADSASLDLTTGMTIEAWVNPTALSGWRTTVLKETPGGLSYALYANDNTPNPAGTIQINGVDRAVVTTAPLALNSWSHLAVTYDGAVMRLYINGVEVGTRAQTGAIVTSTAALRIGGNAVWDEFFAGLIDEVRIYNRALSAAEIQADMNAPVR